MLKTQPIEEQEAVRICLSGRVSESELSYLDEVINSANDSGVMVLLDLEQVTVLDLAAVRYMAEGEGNRFKFSCCPFALRQWIRRERKIATLASDIPTTPKDRSV